MQEPFQLLYLHAVGDALPIRQDLCEVLGAKNISEGGLCQQASGEVSVSHVGHRGDGVAYSEVHNTVHTHSDWILSENLEQAYTL